MRVGGGSLITGAYKEAQNKRLAHEDTPYCTAMCPSTQESGGQGTTTLRIDMLKSSGTFLVTYNMFPIPDQLDVVYEGEVLFSTGGLVSGSSSVQVPFDGASTVVEVTITAPLDGTAWNVFVGCPDDVVFPEETITI